MTQIDLSVDLCDEGIFVKSKVIPYGTKKYYGDNKCTALVVLPKNRLLFAQNQHSFKILEIGSCEVLKEENVAAVRDAVLLPGGKWFAVGYQSGLTFYDSLTYKVVHNANIGKTAVYLVISLPGNKVALAVYNKILVYDYSKKKVVGTYAGVDPIKLFALPNWKLLSVTNRNVVQLWDMKTGMCETTFKGSNYLKESSSEKRIGGACVLLGTNRLLTGSIRGTVFVWDIARGVQLKTVVGKGSKGCGYMIAFPNESFVTECKYGNSSVNVLWSPDEELPLGRIGDQYGYVKRVLFPKHRFLITASGSNAVIYKVKDKYWVTKGKKEQDKVVLKDDSMLSKEVALLKKKNSLLEKTVETLTKKVKELEEKLKEFEKNDPFM